ncbi:MAG: hypothetical protein Q4E83_01750 [bacterium]|nr:hypothetical protein [bacterium]
MKTLDYFRNNDIGYAICQIKYKNGNIITPFLYNDYFVYTTELFLSELKCFENSSLCPKLYNPNLLTIFTNYFALLEQFVSTVHTVVYYCYKSKIIPNEKESLKLFRQDYSKTIDSIINIINVDKTSFRKTKILNKLKELEDARNYILHGNIGKIKTKYTNLPTYPLSINIEDILEILNILLDLFNYFRFIIPNIDLMPSMKIVVQGAVFFKKFDKYFFEILIPYYKQLLEKQQLTTIRNYEINTVPVSPNLKMLASDVNILYKALEEPRYKIKMNSIQSNYYVIQILKVYGIEEIKEHYGMFQLPAFCK